MAILRAKTNAGWLRHVAAKYQQPVVVMARMLRTSRVLMSEVASILNDLAHAEARRLVEGGGKPPTGTDLFDELIRRHCGPLVEQKKERARANARTALAAEMRQQQKREKKAS